MDSDDDGNVSATGERVSWELAEIMGYALVVILGVFLVACVASAATRGSELAAGSDPGDAVLGFANSFSLGLVLQQASLWASPQFATIFIFGSLGMAWWQIESWSAEEGGILAAQAPAHLGRASLLLKLGRVASALCTVGGVFIVVAGVLIAPPGYAASAILTNVGLGVGSVVLGCAGLVASNRLLVACRSLGGVTVAP